jgi:membrane-associated phospholipid phosphatase
VWIALAASLPVVVGVLLAYGALGVAFDRWDSAVLRQIAVLRSGWLTSLMVGVNTVLVSRWTLGILRLGTMAALVGVRRWRHLVIFLGCVVVVGLAAAQLGIFQARVRPLGVTIIGPWDGFSFPSPPVAALAVTLVGMVYALLPPGRPRSRGKWTVGTILLLLALARMYLAVDNPSDLVAGVVLGVAVPVVAFRFFAPNEVFPVTYRRAKAAHLDVGGRRGEALRTGVQEQLGLTVLDVQPVGLEGSAGSTPLRLRVAAGDTQPERDLLPSCTPRATCAPTAPTNWAAPSCTAPWRTKPPSSRCAASSSTRTTPCCGCGMWASRCRRRWGSWRLPPNAST